MENDTITVPLSSEDLQSRIKELTQGNRIAKPDTDLTIVETEGGFRIGDLICTGLPKSQASVLLLLCNGLTRDQCAATLHKSVGAVNQNIHSIGMQFLEEGINGEPEGKITLAIVRAFNWAYLYFANMSVFQFSQHDWDQMIVNMNYPDPLTREAARLVFVDGLKIDIAAKQAGVDFRSTEITVRNIELVMGQAFEMLHFQ